MWTNLQMGNEHIARSRARTGGSSTVTNQKSVPLPDPSVAVEGASALAAQDLLILRITCGQGHQRSRGRQRQDGVGRIGERESDGG